MAFRSSDLMDMVLPRDVADGEANREEPWLANEKCVDKTCGPNTAQTGCCPKSNASADCEEKPRSVVNLAALQEQLRQALAQSA
jgi:hypothetical protein